MEVSICRTPFSLPLIQTLVATNSASRSLSSLARSPATVSDCPYIGDESIIRPPRVENDLRTSRSGARSGSPAPTSKVCQVPMPMTGRDSPVAGIRLVSIIGFSSACAHAGAAIAAAPAMRRNARRSIGCTFPSPAGPPLSGGRIDPWAQRFHTVTNCSNTFAQLDLKRRKKASTLGSTRALGIP